MLRRAADLHGVDCLIVPSGSLVYPHSDDNPYSYRVAPHFRTLLPGFERPGSYLLFDGREKPVLYLSSSEDFWHAPPEPVPDAYASLMTVVNSPDARASVQAGLAGLRWAVLGECEDAVFQGSAAISDQVARISDFIDYHRGYKTAYEVDLIRRANERAAFAHRAALNAFREGRSEYDIRGAYLAALKDREVDQPYNPIVALNGHGAVLHYERCDRAAPAEHLSFLIDAGTTCGGYAADITRTYAFDSGPFHELCCRMEEQQLLIIDQIAPGISYADLHAAMHGRVAEVLKATGVINCSAEAAVEQGITQLFFPHGLGHFIGAQVHDVGGDMADEAGTRIVKDARFPHLRLWRPVEPGQVFTIEPGVYFIDMLLAPKRGWGEINWRRVDELAPYGGVRIEDNVCVGNDGVTENLTRSAFSRLL